MKQFETVAEFIGMLVIFSIGCTGAVLLCVYIVAAMLHKIAAYHGVTAMIVQWYLDKERRKGAK